MRLRNERIIALGEENSHDWSMDCKLYIYSFNRNLSELMNYWYL